ncbi:TonB-dependent receptor plug domain-containing protein [Dechloromonas sp. TW-R-39-2]|uniref:TonB-dependent receptor n=1 Tax=Dechloromonas sp. TW-R-39-2 TaxID=2654218 RepID=UPI00193CD9E6|nr:TonB-dependent receptor [Dechloromonas sp. TW-R-39-2]QRM18019.1 TonB-dependent receptor plug domain-containing protein [Dechloromonas sp. TW-R-39-2]
MKIRQKIIYSYLWGALGAAHGHEATELSAVEVRAQAENLQGIALAGSEGVVSSQRLAATPILRPGEVLEMVPGLIVTQHAGDGKANQYFLRGFNLDHGTDFATTVAGVPVNMPAHAHGQGYTDLNFLIPELVDRIIFRKGPYYADEGDFSSAGAAHIDYFRRLDSSLAQVTLGPNGYARTLLAGSPDSLAGRLLYGLEVFHNDGPWQVGEHYRKLNGVLRYSQGTRHDGWSLTGMAYQGQWTSTDQIAQRAIDRGTVDRFGTLDSTTGGRTFRYSLSGDWAARGENSQRKANVWWLKSGLDLWSNFQYCLNDIAATGGCAGGDQFKQSERRQAGGFALTQTVFDRWGDFDVSNAVGWQGRIDRLSPVGLYNTRQREVWNTVREDRVTQRSLAFWAQNEVRWTSWFRSVQGLRANAYDFVVDANQAANSGKAGDQMLTPKLALVFGPWKKTELYANYGHGFHSNDARGTTISRDPASGDAVDKVKPMVRAKGYEAGVRSEIVSGWQSTVALWQLEAASELVFVGDAGTTEASRPSRRRGVEWTNFYRPADWLAFDADFSWSQARFIDPGVLGNDIPGAVSRTANLGVTLDHLGAWFGALRLRYFGSRPLVEDNSVRAAPSALTNLRIGYKYDRRTQLTLDVYNLFARKLNDIEYWYESRLAGEAGPVFDRHLHPAEPRSLRASILYRF